MNLITLSISREVMQSVFNLLNSDLKLQITDEVSR
jgi:hypothetical protein